MALLFRALLQMVLLFPSITTLNTAKRVEKRLSVLIALYLAAKFVTSSFNREDYASYIRRTHLRDDAMRWALVLRTRHALLAGGSWSLRQLERSPEVGADQWTQEIG